MVELDEEILAEFVTEAGEGLATIEGDLLAIEAAGADIDLDLVNKVFRTIHSMKGAAGFIGLETIGHLAHSAENVLCLVRERTLVPTTQVVNTLLKAADRLRVLFDDVRNSNGQDINDHVVALHAIIANAQSQPTATPESEQNRPFADLPALFDDVSGHPHIADQHSAESIEAELPTEALPLSVETSAPQSLPSQSPVSKPAAAGNAAQEADHGTARKSAAAEASIRVSVSVLDRLMNLAGELVLGRNQLLQAVSLVKSRNLDSVVTRLDQVTSELQETIMQTRMQPVGNVFTKFTRIVRDLGQQLQKECRLVIEGQEVELDKTIIEGIGDPLTHLIRNAVDHGLEKPDVRARIGKDPIGTVALRAFHQEGKVFLEVAEDGNGIDPAKIRRSAVEKKLITREQADLLNDRDAVQLIFRAGFSTAEVVSDVSGRGVGMDVVKTNIERLGGLVEIDTQLGRGTTFRIQLPLTMAIIPSLIVNSGDNWYALPQVNVCELVRVSGAEYHEKIHHIRDAELLRLRGTMLPLLRLNKLLGRNGTKPESQSAAKSVSGLLKAQSIPAVNIVIVQAGPIRYGLVVDELGDPEEIVVKPLGRHLQNSRCLAGATVLGDGSIAMILDIVGVAQFGEIAALSGVVAGLDEQPSDITQETLPTLIFTNHPHEQFGVPMNVVARIERVKTAAIDVVAGQRVLDYRGGSLPILVLDELIPAANHELAETTYVIVFSICGRELGLLAPRIRDIRDIPAEFDGVTFRQPGILGSLVLEGKTTRIVDPDRLAHLAHPEWFEHATQEAHEETVQRTVLLADDSPFFRNTLGEFLQNEGYRIVSCEDGRQAWETLDIRAEEIDLVLTDIEMPNWNGYRLCEAIRGDRRFTDLPVIAITTLSSDSDVRQGLNAGFNDYLVKLNRDQLRNSLKAAFRSRAAARV